MFDLNEWLRRSAALVALSGDQSLKSLNFETPIHRDRLVCADGASLSVQAGAMLYSEPRKNAYEFTAVEVGFPEGLTAQDRALLEPFAEEQVPEWTNTVFPYTPNNIIEAIVEAHGGEKGVDKVATAEEIDFVEKIMGLKEI